MSTPMHDLPEHLYMGVNAEYQGPVLPDEEGYAGMVCWCAEGPECQVLTPRMMNE